MGNGTRFSSDFSGQQRIQGAWIYTGVYGQFRREGVKVYDLVRQSDGQLIYLFLVATKSFLVCFCLAVEVPKCIQYLQLFIQWIFREFCMFSLKFDSLDSWDKNNTQQTGKHTSIWQYFMTVLYRVHILLSSLNSMTFSMTLGLNETNMAAKKQRYTEDYFWKFIHKNFVIFGRIFPFIVF